MYYSKEIICSTSKSFQLVVLRSLMYNVPCKKYNIRSVPVYFSMTLSHLLFGRFFFYWTYLFVYTKLLLWKWNSCSLFLHTKFQQIVSEIFIFPRLAGAQLSIFYATLKDNSEIFEIIICNFAVLEFYNTQVKCLVY